MEQKEWNNKPNTQPNNNRNKGKNRAAKIDLKEKDPCEDVEKRKKRTETAVKGQ